MADPEVATLPVVHSAIPAVQELQTRFLYPFFFRRDSVNEAIRVLQAATIAGDSVFWTTAPPRTFYTDELLPHVIRYLFPDEGVAGSGYLKVSDAAFERLLRHAVLRSPHGDQPFKPVPGLGCEIFLTEQGVGILSIALSPVAPIGGKLTPDAMKEFNYQLSRDHRYSQAFIHLVHPTEDAKKWMKIPPGDQRQIKPAPPGDTGVADRLGAAGGDITTGEFVRALLQPLTGLAYHGVQQGWSLYTVAKFGPEVDFGGDAIRRSLGPFLAALAQAEESAHAGCPDDDLGLDYAILNRRHFAAAGQMGAAHLVADQPSPGGQPLAFNSERVQRIRDKYFIPFLLAFLQRLALHRSLADAAAILSLATHSPSTPERLAELRADLAKFAVGGHFTQVSSRHAVHRFYRLSRTGLDVAPAWQEVRRAIADIETKYSIERERQAAARMAANLHTITKVQTKVEWIECFIISVYFAELCNIGFEALKEGTPEPWFKWVHLASVLVAATFALGISLWLLKPWAHAEQERGALP